MNSKLSMSVAAVLGVLSGARVPGRGRGRGSDALEEEITT